MWKPLARRGLLAAPRLRHAFRHHIQVPHSQTVAPPYIESASRFSIERSHLHHSLRHFSSNPAQNYDDPPSEPPLSETNDGIIGGFDISATNVFDENPKSGYENEDAIFDDAVVDLEGEKGFGVNFDGSVGMDEALGSVAVKEEDGDGQVKVNDPENVERLLSLLQSSGPVSGSLESSFEAMGLVLEEGFVLKVVETPYVLGENLIDFFRWVLKKPGFKVTAPVFDALVGAVCVDSRKREAYALWDLVQEVGEKDKGVLSTGSLNKLIAQFSKLGKGKAAFDVFNKFEDFGCVPDADTYYVTIEALCKRSFNNWACTVCEKMLNAGKLPDVEKVGKIISYLCKGGMPKGAYLVYLYGKDKKIYPPRSSVDFLVSSLSRIERSDKESGNECDKELDKETVLLALGMLDDYSAADRKYAIKPFSSVIKKLCWIEDVGRAKKLLLEMIDSGPPPGNAVFNCVINGLTKVGDMKEAQNVMKLMESRGLKPDVYTYSVIMSGYARSGEMEEACKMLDEAKTKHSKLTPVAYHTLIRGYCKLEQFDKAVNLLGEMKQHGVHPSHDEYNKLIKSLCLKALDWETAEKLEEDMRVNGLILNGRTRALISAVKELKEGVDTEISDPA